jgi:serine/threonine-protein kinase
MRKALRHALEPEHQRAATKLMPDKGEQDSEHKATPAAQHTLPASSSVPSHPTIEAQGPASADRNPIAPNVPTMAVNSRPDPISWSDNQAAPPTVASFAGAKPVKGRRRGLLMIGVVLAAVVIAAVAAVMWQSSRTPEGGQPSSTENRAPSNTAGEPASVKQSAPAGMVSVPGGEFTMGRADGDEYERPAHRVTVKPFFMDTYEVTCAEYDKFVKATGHRGPPQWKTGTCPASDARKPVTGVTWDDANDYAKWAGKRLPTEEEWEFAARGTDGRLYPWGNDWKPGYAHADTTFKEVAEVGSYKGASPFGAYDMVGNAWEWTASSLAAYPGGQLPPQTTTGELKVIRGGSYESTKEYATTTYRTGWPARGAKTYAETGFRCVKDVAP